MISSIRSRERPVSSAERERRSTPPQTFDKFDKMNKEQLKHLHDQMDHIRGQLKHIHREISKHKSLSDSRRVEALSEDCDDARTNLAKIFQARFNLLRPDKVLYSEQWFRSLQRIP